VTLGPPGRVGPGRDPRAERADSPPSGWHTARVLAPSNVTRSADGALKKLPAARGRHWHRFRWLREDMFGNGSLYACRCGVVHSGF